MIPPTRSPGLDRLEAGFLLLFLTSATLSLVAIGLVWMDGLRLMPLLAISLPACVAVVVGAARALRRGAAITQSMSRISGLVTILLTALGALLFTPSAQYVFDGADGSVYLAIASIAERHGTLSPHDPLADMVPPGDRSHLFTQSAWPVETERFPGGIQWSPDGAVRPGFFHLYPVLVASANLIGGARTGLSLNAVFGVLSVLTLWLIGRRISSAQAGAVAAVLLAINFAQVWFARFPASEMLAQYLGLTGLLFSLVALDTRQVWAALGAGAAFGLMAFARIDALVLVTPLVAAAFVAISTWSGRSRPWWWGVTAFAVVTTLAVAYGLTESTAYTLRALDTIGGYAVRRPGNVALGAIAVLVAIWISREVASARPLSRRAMILLVGGGLLVFAFLLWKDATRGYVIRLVSLPGVLLGLGGVLALLKSDSRHRAWPVALLFLAGIVYLRAPMDERAMPWTFRRYVPVLLPLTLLGIAHLGTVARTTRWRSAVWLTVVVFGAWFTWHTWPIVRDPVMRDVAANVRRLAEATPPDALTIWDPSTPSHLPLAFQYRFARESLLVPEIDRGPTALRGLIDQALSAGRAVRLVVDQAHGAAAYPLWREDVRSFDVRLVATPMLRYARLGQSRTVFPTVVTPEERRLEIYDVRRAADDGPPMELPARLDIGGADFPLVLGGFHPKESDGPVSARWTRGDGRILVPVPALSEGTRLVLALRVAASRPAGRLAEVDVEWNGRRLGRVRLSGALETHVLEIGGFTEAIRPAVLTLRSDTFVPRDAGLGDDARSLGVYVDWIEIRDAG